MDIKIIKEPISLEEVKKLAREIYRDMVKGAVDIERGVIALGGEWHMDANKVLLTDGSAQENVWGFNIHVEEHGEGLLLVRGLEYARASHTLPAFREYLNALTEPFAIRLAFS